MTELLEIWNSLLVVVIVHLYDIRECILTAEHSG
jgi:hypothetical protein